MLILCSRHRIDVFFDRIVMPALPLQRVGVHHALLDHLVLAERARLAEHLVDERRLAVVDVGDDGDVSDH
jgi:hypothetical protein